MEVVFDVTKKDKEAYLTIIQEYLTYVQYMDEDEAKEKAAEYLDNLLQGKDFDGNNVPVNQARYFDTLLSKQTGQHYKPTTAVKTKYPRLAKSKKPKSSGKNRTPIGEIDIPIDENQVKRIRDTLLQEYTFLARDDLKEDIENYCRLKVAINNIITSSTVDKEGSVTLKNLMDTQIRLGNYLGIDEGRKAKQKELMDKKSVAALASEFQDTIKQYPDLLKKFRYEELRILLERYDRNELDRALFESPAYANMSVTEAREYVANHERKYE